MKAYGCGLMQSAEPSCLLSMTSFPDTKLKSDSKRITLTFKCSVSHFSLCSWEDYPIDSEAEFNKFMLEVIHVNNTTFFFTNILKVSYLKLLYRTSYQVYATQRLVIFKNLIKIFNSSHVKFCFQMTSVTLVVSPAVPIWKRKACKSDIFSPKTWFL